MEIGKYKIDLIEAGDFALDGGAMFGVVPKTLWSKSYEKSDEMNRIKLQTRLVLLRYDDKVILIDSGNGDKLNEKLKSIYKIEDNFISLTKLLSQYGITPDQITHFIYTHLHFDHSGGSTIIENGKVVPLFKNAKHYLQNQHFQWALNPSEKDKASFMPDNYMPVFESGLVEFTEGIQTILPEIEVIPIFGHTPAMQMIKLNLNNEIFLYPADLTPTHSHIPIPYVMGYDNLPLTTIEEKKKWLGIAYEEKWKIIFEHDAYHQGGIIHSNEKGMFIGEYFNL